MDDINKIYLYLREHGHRITSQKKAILTILLKHNDRMLSATEIKSLIKTGNIDTATIYRNLQCFNNLNLTESMMDGNGISRYKICDSEPHHHMICTNCGKIINFPCTEKLWETPLKENNFMETSHVLVIYGLCSDCSKHPKT